MNWCEMRNGHPWSVSCGDRNPTKRGEDKALLSDLSDGERERVISWINENLLPIASPNGKHTSYGIKHIIQKEIGIYLTNNQFKDAMLECGFEPVEVDALNWVFRISEKSPAFKKK